MKKWAVAAIGTIVVAILSAWALHVFGPNSLFKDRGPTALTFEERINEAERNARELAERTGEDTTPVLAAMKASIWITHISSEGSESGTYVNEFEGVKHRAHVSGYYTDDQGHRCRNVEHTVEPHPNWPGYLREMLKLCEGFSVQQIPD